MRQAVPVKIGSAEFLVEAAESDEFDGGIEPIGAGLPGEFETFDRIRETIEVVSGELVAALEKAKPTEATVEFGINADIKTGKLTGMLVSGGASASLKVTLKWSTSSEDR